MATRYGWEKAEALIKKGWRIKNEFDVPVEDLPIGDPTLIDPKTGIEYNPYEAEKVQQEREIVRYGYYSAQSDSWYGTVIYKTPLGNEVRVTGVFESKEEADRCYLWPDKKFISEVTEFVRSYKRNCGLYDS